MFQGKIIKGRAQIDTVCEMRMYKQSTVHDSCYLLCNAETTNVMHHSLAHAVTTATFMGVVCKAKHWQM